MHTLRAGLADSNIIQHLIREEILQCKNPEVTRDPKLLPLLVIQAQFLENGLLGFVPVNELPTFVEHF